jgi:CheY-like chemotaxis protein
VRLAHPLHPIPVGVGLSILVVDHSPYLGDLMASALENEGFSTNVARTAAEALQIAPSLKPDLVVIDLDEPARIDSDLVCRLNSDPCLRGVPIIALATNPRDARLVDAPNLLCTQKPFYLSEVVAAVQRTLGQVNH